MINMTNYQALLKSTVLSAALLAAVPTTLPADSTINVPAGNVDALIQALHSAALDSGQTEIVVRGKYLIEEDRPLPPVETDVVIRGGANSAIFTSDGDSIGTLFSIEPGARLQLRNLEISDFSSYGSRLISNQGDLDVQFVAFTDVRAGFFCVRGGCFSAESTLVYNSGTLRMKFVTFEDVGATAFLDFMEWPTGGLMINEGQAELSRFQLILGFTYSRFQPLINNSGDIQILNGTLHNNESTPETRLFMAGEGVEIGNSIVSGFDADWCSHTSSLGHNLVSNPDCNLGGPGDIAGISAALMLAPVNSRWNPSGKAILKQALVPSFRSSAVDSGDNQLCAPGSLEMPGRGRRDGNGDGTRTCDRGAVELLPASIAQGGINGLFYNPDSDGHYLYIAQTGKNTMVMWTTFDSEGNHAWVFGIGEDALSNGFISADAYINLNGSVSVAGTFEAADSEHWGRLEVQMTSCNQGSLSFVSDRPEFGSGQFEFRRLAEIDQLGCVDGE